MPALPNPFDSGARPSPPDEAAASSSSHAPAAAADIQGSAPSTEPTTAAVIDSQPVAVAFLDETDCIGEIFAGARKLEQIPGIFDQVAITPADELLYVTLKAMDDPSTRDLPEIPAELWAEFELPPLFLRQAV